MTWILDLLKTFWKPIAGILAGLLVLFQRWRIKRKDETIYRQRQVIRGHEAKEEVHRQDQEIDTETESRIEDIRGRVQSAETPEEAAQEVADEFNEFFSSGEKN